MLLTKIYCGCRSHRQLQSMPILVSLTMKIDEMQHLRAKCIRCIAVNGATTVSEMLLCVEMIFADRIDEGTVHESR